jgi:MFS family permease
MPVELGLKENWKQFALLVVINGFVGGMVGLERTILPEIAEQEFAIAARTAILSFIVVFGIVKAVTNYYAGALANRYGRRRLLIAGWIVGIPIPFMLMYAPDWSWVIAANVLLGINQGLAWSSTVVMKIDLVGDRRRGLAMGLNEFAGYIAVALVAFLTGWIAGEYGVRPYPFYTGIALVALGLFGSVFLIRDTRHHVAKETVGNNVPRLTRIFRETTWTHKTLGSVTQAGLVNNLNDGMVWGLFPILLATKGFSLAEIGTVTAIYPAVWGLGQLVTGAMADRYPKRTLLYSGMLLQALALLVLVWAQTMAHFVGLSVILGWGTAMVYPTFLATVAENTHPQDRAQSIGIFRLWRDLGYAVGAILTGVLADLFSTDLSILAIALLTFASAAILYFRMPRTPRLSGALRNVEPAVHSATQDCYPAEDLRDVLRVKPQEVILVDVRAPEEYAVSHIAQAKNVPLTQLETDARMWPRTAHIVTVCGKGGGRSEQAARLLRQMGFTRASFLCGGTTGWLERPKLTS